MKNNLDWWHRNGFFKKSAELIGHKIGDPENKISHFIDCNCLETDRPAGGPAEAGPDGMRWDPLIQVSSNDSYLLIQFLYK